MLQKSLKKRLFLIISSVSGCAGMASHYLENTQGDVVKCDAFGPLILEIFIVLYVTLITQKSTSQEQPN